MVYDCIHTNPLQECTYQISSHAGGKRSAKMVGRREGLYPTCSNWSINAVVPVDPRILSAYIRSIERCHAGVKDVTRSFADYGSPKSDDKQYVARVKIEDGGKCSLRGTRACTYLELVGEQMTCGETHILNLNTLGDWESAFHDKTECISW